MSYADKHPVLVTGGTGFVGSYLALALLERGESVVLFDRDPDQRRLTGFAPQFADYQKDRRVSFVQGDLSLLPHVLATMDKHEPKAVFHLGALLSAGTESNPTMGFQVDLIGTWNVLEAARLYGEQRQGEPVRVLFPSTIASFGSFLPSPGSVSNESVQMPTTMYGVAKVASERLGEYYHAKKWVDFRAVRFPSVVGAARGPGGTTVYSTLMMQFPLLGRGYDVYVKPERRLDVLYVKDAVRALLDLHDAPRLPDDHRRVYNIAGIRENGQPPTAQEIAAAVEKVAGNGKITFNGFNPTLDSTVQGFGILNDANARADWKWRGAQYDLKATIADFAVELKNYPGRLKALELY
jgi:threonine 3-dehydrogenase